MHIAIMTDVHGNWPALEAALAAIDRLGVDAIYHTGDAIGIGPFPRECLDALLGRTDVRCVMGNHDEWFAFGLPEADWMSAGEREHQLWTHQQLDPASRDAVGRWPYSDRIDGAVGFIHYPRNADGLFFAPSRHPIGRTPVHALFDVPPALVFFGHDHNASNVAAPGTRFVNPGSLGCSVDPAARFATVRLNGRGGHDVVMHAEPYDPTELLIAFEARGVPERAFIRRTFVLPSLPTPD